jgi:hypothetical protein
MFLVDGKHNGFGDLAERDVGGDSHFASGVGWRVLDEDVLEFVCVQIVGKAIEDHGDLL